MYIYIYICTCKIYKYIYIYTDKLKKISLAHNSNS